MIYILRNNQKYGPYNDSALVSYVNSGQLLLVDTLIDDTTGETTTVRRYLKKHNIKVKVQHGGSFANQLNKIGTELLVPKDAFKKKSIITDTRLILLGLVGLVPSILMFLPIGGFFVFYLVSLYFAIIWGLFFYYFFKTPQVSIKTTILVFFITQVAVFLIWDILGLPALNPFYNLVNTVFPLTLFGYIFGVGLTEELGKALPLFIINHRTNVPLLPQTIVF